jgi:cobalt-zinc-cadmium efflux system membrane fusion protein
MASGLSTNRFNVAISLAVLVVLAGVYWSLRGGEPPKPKEQGAGTAAAAQTPDGVDLSDSQLSSVKVEPVELRDFPKEVRSIGSISFNDDLSVQVFTPYQGRIIALFAQAGDDVKKGQTLFTIDSPDLLQAESTLIAAAGVLDLTTKNLARLRDLFTTRAVSQRDLDQGTSDQQTAEGNLRAARDSVRLFGKSDAEIDRIVANRLADPTLVVPSPIDGRVTARSAAPGLFVQPANAPAPFVVTNIDTMWMLANVPERDSPPLRTGQEVSVSVDALPGRSFSGKVTTISASVDATTRRVLVRSEVADPHHELRSGMFANFVIQLGPPVRAPGIALDGVVREGDGTMTIWITADRRRFVRRVVTIGDEHDGYRQITDGVRAGELVATEGAVFLSNQLALAAH